jgi:transposase
MSRFAWTKDCPGCHCIAQVGQPSKLDDLRAKRIVDAIRNGVSRTGAAASAGISRRALMDWLARGRDGEARYEHFLHRVQQAEAEAEAGMVACVRTAALDPKYWGAAAWWLERCRPADYAKREPTRDEETERAETGADDLEVARSVVAALESRKKSA